MVLLAIDSFSRKLMKISCPRFSVLADESSIIVVYEYCNRSNAVLMSFTSTVYTQEE